MSAFKDKFKPDLFHNYRCSLIKVIDADTVKLDVDLGFRIRFIDNFRLARIDAPEINTPEGKNAREILTNLLLHRELVLICKKHEKYRWLAELFINRDGSLMSVSDWLLEQGLAKEYK